MAHIAILVVAALSAIASTTLLLLLWFNRRRKTTTETYSSPYTTYDALRDRMEGPCRRAHQVACELAVADLCGPSVGRCFAYGMARCMESDPGLGLQVQELDPA